MEGNLHKPVALAGALLCLLAILSCSSSHSLPSEGAPPAENAREIFPGIRDAYGLISFYNSTLGINPAKHTSVSTIFENARPGLSDGYSSNLVNQQAALDVAFAVCRTARQADEARPLSLRRHFPRIDFNRGAAVQLNRELSEVLVESLFRRFSGKSPGSRSKEAAIATLQDLANKNPNDIRLVTDAFCGVMAGSALSSLAHR